MKTILFLSVTLVSVLALTGCTAGAGYSTYDPHGYDAAGSYYGSEYGGSGYSYTTPTGERY